MKELLEALIEACPGRFRFIGDGYYDGRSRGYDLAFEPEWPRDEWLFHELNRLPIGAIWKTEGKSWEESILQAIVHWHQTNKEGK